MTFSPAINSTLLKVYHSLQCLKKLFILTFLVDKAMQSLSYCLRLKTWNSFNKASKITLTPIVDAWNEFYKSIVPLREKLPKSFSTEVNYQKKNGKKNEWVLLWRTQIFELLKLIIPVEGNKESKKRRNEDEISLLNEKIKRKKIEIQAIRQKIDTLTIEEINAKDLLDMF